MFLKAYGLVLLFLKKKIVLSVAHGDLFFAEVGPKNRNFFTFQQKIFRTTGFQLKFLKLIEFPNISNWKQAKKIKVGVGLGQYLNQIKSNVVKKSKETDIIIRFFSYFTWGIPSKAKSSGYKTP